MTGVADHGDSGSPVASPRRTTSVVERGGVTIIDAPYQGIVLPVERVQRGRYATLDGRWIIQRYGREWVIEATNEQRAALLREDPVTFSRLGDAAAWVVDSLNTHPEAES